MCSACITSSPPASNSAVEQSRRSVMLGEWAERISTAPISSQAARRAPTRTWSETGSRPLSHRRLLGERSCPPRRPRADQPGGSTRVASGSSNTHGPVGLASRPRARRAGPRPRRHSPPKRARRVAALDRLGAGRPRARTRARARPPRARIVTSSTRRLGVAVAVAALVLGGEPLGELVRGRALGSGLDGELERLAAVAQLVADLGRAPRRGPRRAARAGAATSARDPLGGRARRRAASPCGRRRGGARRRAARAPRAPRSRAGRAAARSRARRRSPPRASARRRRTASARSRRGSTPRSTVTTRSARTISWFATRTIPSAVGQRLDPELAGEPRRPPPRRRRRRARPRRRGVESALEVAEQQVGVGDRRLAAAAPVAGRSRARRPPSAGPTRSAPPASRQPIEPPPAPTVCTSTIGSWITRPPISRESVRRTRPSSTTQTSHEVPPMSKPSALPSPREPRQQPGADGAAGRAREHAPGAGARRLGRRGDAARGHHHRRLRQPALARRLAEPAEVAAEQGGEVGVDDRGRAALVLAKLGQHLVRGRDVDVGQLGAQALGDRALVRGLEVGEQQADGDRLGAESARARRRSARARRRSSASITPPRPDPLGGLDPVARRRPAAPAFGAQRR